MIKMYGIKVCVIYFEYGVIFWWVEIFVGSVVEV